MQNDVEVQNSDEKILFGEEDSSSQNLLNKLLGKRNQKPGLTELPLYKIAKTEAWSRVESSSEEGMSKVADKPEKQASMARQVRRYKSQAQEARSESKDLRGKLQKAQEQLNNKQKEVDSLTHLNETRIDVMTK